MSDFYDYDHDDHDHDDHVSTSAVAYRDALEEGLISRNQYRVLMYMKDKNGPVIQGEVNRHFGETNRSYGARFIELEDSEVIKCIGTTEDRITGRIVKQYVLTGKPLTNQVRRKKRQKFVYALCYVANGPCGYGEPGSEHLALKTQRSDPFTFGSPEPVYSTREKAEVALATLPKWAKATIVELKVK